MSEGRDVLWHLLVKHGWVRRYDEAATEEGRARVQFELRSKLMRGRWDNRSDLNSLELDGRTLRALQLNGVRDVEALRLMSDDDLLALHQFGPDHPVRLLLHAGLLHTGGKGLKRPSPYPPVDLWTKRLL